MNFILKDRTTGKPVGRLSFMPNGTPRWDAPVEVLQFLADINKVWLPASKSLESVDFTNEDHQFAAVQQLATIGYRAMPL